MKIRLRTDTGVPESLNDLYNPKSVSIVDIEDACEDAKNALELAETLNNMDLYRKFQVSKETEQKIRLKATDFHGNVSWFEVYK